MVPYYLPIIKINYMAITTDISYAFLAQIQLTFWHPKQDLSEQVTRIAELLDSQAVSAHVSNSHSVSKPPHDGGEHLHVPEEEALPGRQTKMSRRKGPQLVRQQLGGTASVGQALPAEVGNPAPLTPDTAEMKSEPGVCQGHTALLVSRCDMSIGNFECLDFICSAKCHCLLFNSNERSPMAFCPCYGFCNCLSFEALSFLNERLLSEKIS